MQKCSILCSSTVLLLRRLSSVTESHFKSFPMSEARPISSEKGLFFFGAEFVLKRDDFKDIKDFVLH